MTLAESVPGMKPGSHVRNVGVGAFWIMLALMLVGYGASTGGDSGGASDTTAATDGGASAAQADQTQSNTDGDSGASSGTSERTSSSSQSSDHNGVDSGIVVRIDYIGDWQGSISAGGTSASVDGYGVEHYRVNGDPSVVSVSAQKADDSYGELTVEILVDGEVVAQQSTSADYGVVTTSASKY